MFVAGSVISGLALLLGCTSSRRTRIVARVNIARAAESADATTPLDLPYLASLGGDAVPLAVRATLAAPARLGAAQPGRRRRTLRRRVALLHRWGPASGAVQRQRKDGAWRTWNAGERLATRVVGEHSAELLPRGPCDVPARLGTARTRSSAAGRDADD